MTELEMWVDIDIAILHLYSPHLELGLKPGESAELALAYVVTFQSYG